MKRQGLRFFLTLFFLILLSPAPRAGEKIVFGEIGLIFDNLLSPSECFRRYHTLLLGADYAGFALSLQYNWLDEVEGPVSTHTLTPWVLALDYRFDQDRNLKFKYHYLVDVFDDSQSRDWERVEYVHFFNQEEKFYPGFKIGLDNFNEPGAFEAYLGLLLAYRLSPKIACQLKYDWLTSIDDALTNPERAPLTLAVRYRFNPGVSILFEYNHMFASSGEEIDRWLRTGLTYRW